MDQASHTNLNPTTATEPSSSATIKDTSNLKKPSDPYYNAYHDAPFLPLEDIPFSFLTNCFEEISSLQGGNAKEKIIEIISNMFRSILLLNPDQLIFALYFCTARLAPDYDQINELAIGDRVLVKVISKTSGRTEKNIQDSFNSSGDLGKVAVDSTSNQASLLSFFNKAPCRVTVSSHIQYDIVNLSKLKHVMDSFRNIVSLKGANTASQQESQLVKLFMLAKGQELKYIVRFIQKNLKTGVSDISALNALIRAFVVSNYFDEKSDVVRDKPWDQMISDYNDKMKKYEEIIRNAVFECPNHEKLILGLLKVGKNIEDLREFCRITPGIPVKPMIAKPIVVKGFEMIAKNFGEQKWACEYKYDGIRAQVHYSEGKCQIFSRNLENIDNNYSDVIDAVLNSIQPKVKGFIIDAEIVAINPQTSKIMPFHLLASRNRNIGDKNAAEVNVCLYVFDILYLNEDSLLRIPLFERRKYLEEHFKPIANRLELASHLVTNDLEETLKFLNKALEAGCEGLMIKALGLNSEYEPSKRSSNWLKLKKDYLSMGPTDTFDLVPIGAINGTDKTAGLYKAYLMACYNKSKERYETVCKIGVGFTEQQLVEFHKFFSEHIIKEPLHDYKLKGDEAQVWFVPCAVWEVAAADIQVSTTYTSAIGEADPEKGLGLRFPRFIRVRTDKAPYEATDSAAILEAYKGQQASTSKDNNNEIY